MSFPAVTEADKPRGLQMYDMHVFLFFPQVCTQLKIIVL